MNHSEPIEDPELGKRRREIVNAAKKLNQNQMIEFDENMIISP
jgi:hypothetical protein